MARLKLSTVENKQWRCNCYICTSTVTAILFKKEHKFFNAFRSALDISERKICIGVILAYQVGHWDTKRARPPLTPAGSGESGKVIHAQEKARREVGLSSNYLEENSKPRLNRSLRPQSCQCQDTCTCIYFLDAFMLLYRFFGVRRISQTQPNIRILNDCSLFKSDGRGF